MEFTEALNILKEEMTDWEDVLAGYQTNGEQERQEEGRQSLETTEDIGRVTRKILAYKLAISLLGDHGAKIPKLFPAQGDGMSPER